MSPAKAREPTIHACCCHQHRKAWMAGRSLCPSLTRVPAMTVKTQSTRLNLPAVCCREELALISGGTIYFPYPIFPGPALLEPEARLLKNRRASKPGHTGGWIDAGGAGW